MAILEKLTEEECYLYAILQDDSGLDQAEFLWYAPEHEDTHGCFRAWPFQHRWWRSTYEKQIDQCARSVGKSLSLQVRACAFPFIFPGEEMLLTAPEGNHLEAVTDLIETRLLSLRFYREILKKTKASNGIKHRPFQINFANGARIMGRIPQRDGRGVKGMHPIWLEMDEAQDYPKAGWTELFETLKTTRKGSERWRSHGVTRGIRDEFWRFTQENSDWQVHRFKAMNRPTWDLAEKKAAIGKYGSENHPDYRRNIQGLHGDMTNPMFVLTRLMACVDGDPSTDYNMNEYQLLRISDEMINDMGGDIYACLDMPMSHKKHKLTWAGCDFGLTNHPSEILTFAEEGVKGMEETRLKLLSRIHLERVSAPNQRRVIMWLVDFYKLKAFSCDKMQPVSEPVLTPKGWISIGSLSIGDEVVGSDGLPTKVTGVYPQNDTRVMKVSFSDGSSTRCGPEHLWNVSRKVGRRTESVTATTEEIASAETGNGTSRWWIPILSSPVMYTDAPQLPVDPYALGLLLGDGNLREHAVRFSSADKELVDSLGRVLPEGMTLKHSGQYDYDIVDGPRERDGLGRFSPDHRLLNDLRRLGLAGLKSHEKFIPEDYIRASPADRLALLQGLMDSDGFHKGGASVGIRSSSESLMRQLREIVESLGGYTSFSKHSTFIGEKQYRDAYLMTIALPDSMPPFRLKRKRDKLAPRKVPLRRYITNIERDDPEESVCIRVEAEDSLYVTRHHLLTHNTGMGLPIYQELQEMAEGNPEIKNVLETIKGYNFSEKILVDFDDSIDVDEFGGDEVEDRGIKRRVLEYSSDKLREYVDKKRLLLPGEDDDLLQEFQGQTWTYDKSGMDMYGRKVFSTGSFHALDAARMAILGQSQYEIEAFMRQHRMVKKSAPVFDQFL